MKSKDKQALAGQSVAELTKLLSETSDALAKIMVSRYTKPSKNVREGKAVRNKRAVVYSILSQKKIA